MIPNIRIRTRSMAFDSLRLSTLLLLGPQTAPCVVHYSPMLQRIFPFGDLVPKSGWYRLFDPQTLADLILAVQDDGTLP